MTIRVYPSRLEGEPLETHETTGRLTIAEWVQSVAPDFDINAVELHPTIRVNGSIVEPDEWLLTFFGPGDTVDVYIEAKGIPEAVVYAAIALAAIAITMVLTMKAPSQRKQGKTIEDPGALANQARWGDPIPEIAGAPRTYPDYITPPRRYYLNQTQQWVDSLVCIGMGKYQLDASQVFIGDTSAPTMGDDIEIRFFQPGEEIPSPYRDWWHTPEEVGFTTFGGAGLTLGGGADIDRHWDAAFTFDGHRYAGFAFVGSSVTGVTPPPASWSTGLFVSIEAYHKLVFSGNTVQSELLDTLQLTTGDEFEISGERAGVYTISTIYAGTGGSAGSPATATGSVVPDRFDFSSSAGGMIVGLNSFQYFISLTANAIDLSGLIDAINSQLNGSPIRAREATGGVLELYQIQPYNGGVMTLSGGYAELLGTPVITQGTAATPSIGTRYAVSGADFGTGSEIAAAGLPGFLYTITNISGNTITVSPPELEFWTGFPAGVSGTTSSVQMDPSSLDGGWMGPFAAAPEGEQSDAIEVDIFYPAGLIRHDNKGRIRERSAGGVIQWRLIGDTEWVSTPFSSRQATPDQIGFTYLIEHTPGRVEVRVRADSAPSTDTNVSDKRQWTGLRSRIIGAPTSYPDMTVAHVRLRSGDKVSGSVENKMSIRAMRILPTVENPEVEAPTRDIAPFFIHMMSTVGYGRDLIDMEHIKALHEIWRERGDTFDLSANGTSTLKTVANYCLQAGFAELTMRRGLISAARDAYRRGSPPRVYSPQELVTPLIESTESIMPDDIDGVDIEYVDYLTGRTLTESYRLIGDEGRRVEKIQAPGVTGRTQAWRLAARRRRVAAYRRTAYKGSTELSAMNSFYMDYVGLQDGIPEWGQSAFVIDHDGLVLTLSEDVQPTGGPPVIMIRRADGTASPPIPVTVAGRRVTLPSMPPDVTVTNDPNHPTVVYIGRRTQVVHEALITEVRPSGNSTVELQAVNMDNRVYIEDDMEPDQIILTSGLYPVIFDDGIAPWLAEPSTDRNTVLKNFYIDDSVGVGLVAPAIFRRNAVRYLSYRNAEPEAIGVGLIAPAIKRIQEVIPVIPIYYQAFSGPESIGVGLLSPAIFRKKVADRFDYRIPEESISVGVSLLAPTKED